MFKKHGEQVPPEPSYRVDTRTDAELAQAFRDAGRALGYRGWDIKVISDLDMDHPDIIIRKYEDI
jgi:hypothetical protein